MPLDDLSVTLNSIEKLKDTINIDRIKKDISIGVGLYARELDGAIRFAVKQRYSINKNIDSLLIGDVASTQQFGRNTIRSGLIYRYKPIDLAKFPYAWFLGNINEGAKRKGRVHYVSVKRGDTKIVYGKEHRGGFTVKNGSYGTQMFERKSNSKFPLRLLFGPSITQMIGTVLITSPEVKRVVDNFESFVYDIVDNYYERK